MWYCYSNDSNPFHSFRVSDQYFSVRYRRDRRTLAIPISPAAKYISVKHKRENGINLLSVEGQVGLWWVRSVPEALSHSGTEISLYEGGVMGQTLPSTGLHAPSRQASSLMGLWWLGCLEESYWNWWSASSIHET